MTVTKTGEDYDKASWNIYWQLFNLLQLAVDYPSDLSFSQNDNTFTVKTYIKDVEDITSEEEDAVDILTYYDEEYHKIVVQLLANNIDFSKDGSFIITNENDNVVAEAVLGFPDSKIVFGVFEESIDYFQEQDYRMLLPSECTDELLHQIKNSQV